MVRFLAASFFVLAFVPGSALAVRQAGDGASAKDPTFVVNGHWECQCTCVLDNNGGSVPAQTPGKCDGSEAGSSCQWTTSGGTSYGTLEYCSSVFVIDRH